MRYLNGPAVEAYLNLDTDIRGVIETNQAHLYEKSSKKRVDPWHLYLCSEVNFKPEPGTGGDIPSPHASTAAYLLCGNDFTYSEFSLEWSEYCECWYIRVVEAEDGRITLDTEDVNRHSRFDKAWEAFCKVAAETEAVEAMKALYVSEKPKPKIPVIDRTPRPSIFGTWS